MITPKWVSSAAQPIAIDDLLAYLTKALFLPVNVNRIFEIGGADQVSYAGIMRAYARQRGMRIRMIPVPVLTPFLSSLWLGLVTPLYARIGRKLIESIVHSTVVSDKSALETFDIRPAGVDEAVRKALASEDKQFAATRWSDALSSSGNFQVSGDYRKERDGSRVSLRMSAAARWLMIPSLNRVLLNSRNCCKQESTEVQQQ